MPVVSSEAVLKRVRGIVSEVDPRIEAKLPGIADLWRFGRRTPHDILTSGKAPTAFGCLDRSAAIGASLAANGITTYLVMERTLHQGRSIGVHFHLEGTDGETQFTVEPHSLKTKIFEGWHAGSYPTFIPKPYRGTRNVQRVRVRRALIPADAMHVPMLTLAGIRSRREFLRLAQFDLRIFVPYLLTRLEAPMNLRIARARAWKKKRST